VRGTFNDGWKESQKKKISWKGRNGDHKNGKGWGWSIDGGGRLRKGFNHRALKAKPEKKREMGTLFDEKMKEGLRAKQHHPNQEKKNSEKPKKKNREKTDTGTITVFEEGKGVGGSWQEEKKEGWAEGFLKD